MSSNNTPQEVNRIDDVARLVASQIPILFAEAHDKMSEAITSMVEDNQDRRKAGEAQTPLVLSLAIAVKWHIDEQAVEISMPVAVKKKFERTVELKDPNQPDMFDGDGDRMPAETQQAVRRLARAVRDGNVKFTVQTPGAAADAKTRGLAAKVLTLEEENPRLHAEAQKVMQEQGVSYVDALTFLANRKAEQIADGQTEAERIAGGGL